MGERKHKPRHGSRMLVSILLAAVIGGAGVGGYAFAAGKAEQTPHLPVYVTPEKPTVYLTFDDGPSPVTDQVLDILHKEGIKATFFVVGAQAEKNVARLRKIVAQGHAVGNHSYNHVYEEIYGSFKSFAGQVVKTNAVLKKKANVTTRLVRAPGGTFGNFDSVYFNALYAAGYILFDWNVDSGDAKRLGVPAKEIAANILNAKLGHEMIVLMHDGGGHKETAAALPQIIKHFKAHGYKFATLSEKVKPLTFRLAPTLKWKRVKPSTEQAVVWLGGQGAALATQAAETTPQQPVPPKAADTTPGPPPAAAEPADTTPEQPAAAEPAETTVYISLRDWMTEAGGSVSWDPHQGIVFAFVQGYEMHFIPQSTQVDIVDPQGAAHSVNIPLVWQNGVLMLPADDLGQLLAPSSEQPDSSPISLTLPQRDGYNSLN
jgi:peptidoglycan-N-acetylglucosamine deacetylase